ncbi:MAG: hypothetical protein U0441_00640 [Polyangiaceae bacterium]
MAKARTFDEKRARIREVDALDPNVARIELRKALSDKNGYLVGEAADAAKRLEFSELGPDLAAAFPRLCEGGVKGDPGCFGKSRVIEALLYFDAQEPDVYLRGLTYRQVEGAYPFQVDTAAGLRGMCAHALFHIRYPHAILDVAPLLFDPEAVTRSEAAAALGESAFDGAAAALHMKVLIGDPEPDVMGAAYKGLLTLFPNRYLKLAEEALPAEDGAMEAAALALGESRAEGALAVLQRALKKARSQRATETLMLGISLLRHDQALSFLVSVVKEATEKEAVAALAALALHKHDDSLKERLRAVVRERGSERVEDAMTERFGP